MKSLMLLWQTLAYEMASRCCTSATRDFKTVTGRCKHEGLSFLTITLPAFGKDFEKSLDLGRVDRSLFTAFGWRAGLPLFLGGFLDRVFDRKSGVLLDNPDVDAIHAIRQLTLMFGKMYLPCSDARVRTAISGFIQCEHDVKVSDRSLEPHNVEDFKRISGLLFGKALKEVDRKVLFNELKPKHGPGATADKLTGNGKYKQTTWPARLEKIFPSRDYLLPNDRYFDRLDEVDIIEPGSETPVKVISVPKTLKTPRIIAVEPVAMQYVQQALLDVILKALKRDDILNRFLGFDDQVPNQDMARKGSLNGDLATLDLSEASDRVSNQHVRALLEPTPILHMAVDACRSRKADVPGHGVIRLAKFASMGSALTFPMEAMVFLTMVFIGIERELNTTLDRRTLKRFVDQVRIYGDDIIVPVDYVHSVVSVLTDFGLIVNTGKSFWTGKFRESCGREYYEGNDVSIVKVRHMFPTRRQDATEVISMISLRNQLYMSGCWQTCRWLDERITQIIKHYPVVLPSSPVQGRYSFLGYETQYEHPTLHSPLVRGYVVHSVPPSDKLDDMGALLKYLLKRGRMPSADSRHLERAGRPQSVNIKLRKASPF